MSNQKIDPDIDKEDLWSSYKHESIKFPARDFKPSRITIDKFTEKGKQKQIHNQRCLCGVEAKIEEGEDFTREVVPYETFMPQVIGKDRYGYKFTPQKKSQKKTKGVIAALLLVGLSYIPQLEEAKANLQKYFNCREYRIEYTNGKSVLYGIDCRLKIQEIIKTVSWQYKT